jgi:hypothetical protein
MEPFKRLHIERCEIYSFADLVKILASFSIVYFPLNSFNTKKRDYFLARYVEFDAETIIDMASRRLFSS